SASPWLTAVQLAPSSVERSTPSPLVPANNVVPLAAKAKTLRFVRPLWTAAQLAPASLERNTLTSDPPNRLVPLTATPPPPPARPRPHGPGAQPVVGRRPARAGVARPKCAGAVGPREHAAADRRHRGNAHGQQPVLDRRPGGAVVGRAEHAAFGPGEEAAAAR